MAKLVQPLMSLEARGKMGALIYNTWRSIATTKAYAAPVQPGTPEQVQAKSLLTDASRAWRSLTQAQRDTWLTYAVNHLETDWTGQAKRLTGQNWFIRCYVNKKYCQTTAPTSAPGVNAPAAPTGFAASYVTGTPNKINITWTTPTTSGLWIDLWTEGPVSPGRQNSKVQSRRLIILEANETKPYTLYTSPVSGKYGVWARTIDDVTGLASNWVMSSVIVP